MPAKLEGVDREVLPAREMLIRMRTFVPGPVAGDLIRLIQLWERSSGKEWTVERLKKFRLNLLKHLAGLEADWSWIATVRGVPKGPFGYLFRLAGRNRAKAWNALMAYTGFKAARITEKQYRKFLQALSTPEPEHLRDLRSKFAAELRRAYGTVPRSNVRPSKPLYMYPWSSTRVAPHDAFGNRGPEYKQVLDPVSYTTLWRFLYSEVAGPLLKGLENRLNDPLFRQGRRGIHPPSYSPQVWKERSGWSTIDDDSHWGLVGEINAIQEPGWKLRFVANPFRVYQAAFLDSGRILWNALRDVKEDYTYNQLDGILTVQSALASGKKVYSFDLENATDCFPRTYLQELSWKFWDNQNFHAFWYVAEGRWALDKRAFQHMLPHRLEPGDVNQPEYCTKSRSSTGAERSCYMPDCPVCFIQDTAHRDALEWDTYYWVSWKNGVPLGLFPSFPMFALSHHSVLVSLLPKRSRKRPWAIVGDDVCIWDDSLARDYQARMTELGVRFNESKTIASDVCAEFLGHLVFKDGVIPRYKWRSHSDDSFWDMVRNFGLGIRPLLSPRQKAVVDALAEVPEPLGLGLNPKGKPFMERLEPWLDLWLESIEAQKIPIRLIEPATWLNRQLYPSWWYTEGIEPDLPDRGEREMVTRSLGLWGLEEHLLNALEDPDRLKLLSAKLRNPAIREYIEKSMVHQWQKSHLTNLEKLERLIKHR